MGKGKERDVVKRFEVFPGLGKPQQRHFEI